MSAEHIILLDLPSKAPCSSWSLNPWKTRLILNFKNINYKTEWTEYPDIQPKVQPHLPPNEAGSAYTIPTVKLPDGTWIMDSAKIAPALERLYPEPSLHLDSPYLTKVAQLFGNAFSTVNANCYARIPVNLLNDASLEHWYTTRRERLGMSVDEFEEKRGGEPSYVAAEPHLQQITQLLKENDGPFFLGMEPSYADFVWVAALTFFRRLDEAVYREILQRAGDQEVHERLLEACAPWLKRNDH